MRTSAVGSAVRSARGHNPCAGTSASGVGSVARGK